MTATLQPLRPATYRQTTQATALAQLAARLDDPANIFWARSELRLYLVEALRTWQAYTSWYRTPAQLDPTDYLSASTGAAWYDLSILPGMSYNVTWGDLAGQLACHLLEVPATQQFPPQTIQNAVQNRMRRFRADSGIVIDYMLSTAALQPPSRWDSGVQWSQIPPIYWSSNPNGKAVLVGDVIDVRRAAWVDSTGYVRNLWRANEWEMNSFRTDWMAVTGPPQVYSLAATRPLTMQIAPGGEGPGVLEILAVGPGPDIADPRTILAIPDDFTWGVKFGALADLLSGDGEAKDVARAQYCAKRYEECVELARSFPSVVNARTPASKVVWTGSVFEMDAFAAGWQNAPSAFALGMGGRNLAAISAQTSVWFDLAANFPVPAADSDWINLPADAMHAVIDYAQHLAAFKMGGDEFFATEQQRASFVQAAAMQNSRLRQLNFYNEAMRAPAAKNLGPIPRIMQADLTAPAYGAGVRPQPQPQGQQ